jgi:hypothetical protein
MHGGFPLPARAKEKWIPAFAGMTAVTDPGFRRDDGGDGFRFSPG